MNFLKSISLLLVIIFVSLNVNAQQADTYYPEDLINHNELANQDLKLLLNRIVKLKHQKMLGASDKIVENCETGSTCYQHISTGYEKAKVFTLAHYNLQQDAAGYEMKDVYCEKEYKIAAPNVLPDSAILNVEHTWPQSKFTGKFSADTQKSDLHHLYPSDSRLNSDRSNFEFGEVDKLKKVLKCESSRLGYAKGGGPLIFEPPTDHRGNVARALFYFSIRYQMPIDSQQETFLKEWNKQDPVDEQEIDRNNEIFKAQGNRNPFVDMPDLADRISDF